MRAGWNHIVSEYTKFDAIVNIPGKFAFVDLTDEPMPQTPKDVDGIASVTRANPPCGCPGAEIAPAHGLPYSRRLRY